MDYRIEDATCNQDLFTKILAVLRECEIETDLIWVKLPDSMWSEDFEDMVFALEVAISESLAKSGAYYVDGYNFAGGKVSSIRSVRDRFRFIH